MSDEDQDDSTLIQQIALSQVDALGELYDRYNRLVFSVALAIVGNRATAAELTLDVFTHVWQRANTYRADRAKVNTWLTAITRYHAIDTLRRQGTRPDSGSLSWDELASQGAPAPHELEEGLELSWQQERVRAAVAQLPIDQQQALVLAYFQGYTHPQIAEILNQPLGTIKTRIRLAMQKLRQMLQDEQPSLNTSKSVSTAYYIDENG
jgi:RNA polymerase sigma-70 factor, ECF subfamily